MVISKCCSHIIYCLAVNTAISMKPDYFSDLIAVMSLYFFMIKTMELNHISIVHFSYMKFISRIK